MHRRILSREESSQTAGIKMGITVKALGALKPNEWLTEPGNRNEGALRAKGGPHGARFYYRYRNSEGRYDDLPIGSFDSDGKRGMTLENARRRVTELRTRYLNGDRDLRATLQEEIDEVAQRRAATARELEADAAKKRATLGALLDAYVEQLKRSAKPSMRSVQRALKRHVADAWPEYWEKPVADVTTDDLLAVIARVANAEKLREAAKVRSYLTAAFAAAIRARQDARGLPALRALGITSNPARDLVTIDGATNARERALSVAELRAYWKRISALPAPNGALLRFHLLTGGQRATQLGRLTMADYDVDSQTVRMRDGKGRRKVARIHDVPLIPEAIHAVSAMQGGSCGQYLFTVTAGESGAAYATLQHRVREVSEEMVNAEELEKGPFTVGDLRRTVETRLAAAGVSLEVRAQLQSHGLGGIQARHYDRHDYLVEKREALGILHELASGVPGTVTPIRRGGRH